MNAPNNQLSYLNDVKRILREGDGDGDSVRALNFMMSKMGWGLRDAKKYVDEVLATMNIYSDPE